MCERRTSLGEVLVGGLEGVIERRRGRSVSLLVVVDNVDCFYGVSTHGGSTSSSSSS